MVKSFIREWCVSLAMGCVALSTNHASLADECDCALPDGYTEATGDPCLCAIFDALDCEGGSWAERSMSTGVLCLPVCEDVGSMTCSEFAQAVLDKYSTVMVSNCKNLCGYPDGLRTMAQIRATFCEWRMRCILDEGCDRTGDGKVDGEDLSDYLDAVEDQESSCCDTAETRAKAICLWLEHCATPSEPLVGVPCEDIDAVIDEYLPTPSSARTSAEACRDEHCGVPGDEEDQPITRPGPHPGVGGGSCATSAFSDRYGSTGSPPVTTAPVDLAHGHKYETAIDLVVPVVGVPFKMVREYTSNPGYTAPGPMGEKWSASILRDFKYTVEDPGGPGQCCSGTAGGLPLGSVGTTDCMCDDDDPSGSLSTPGDTTQYYVKDDVDGEWPVWRLVEPGQWSVLFYREKDASDMCSGCEDPDPALVGRILRAEDTYGNYHQYSWAILPKIGGGTTARLAEVTCYTSDDVLQARISFVYNFAGSGQPAGTLARIEVSRPRLVSNGEDPPSVVQVEVPTQRATYLYLANDDTKHLGLTGDLVQVQVDERVDPAPGATGTEPVWRSLVTQYRYHAGTAEAEDDDGYDDNGHAHQLKMIIMPEQVEYYAQKKAEDFGSGVHYVTEFLEDLMELEDGEPDDDVALKPVELASKIVAEYETSSPYRVEAQYILTGCGCGSGGTQGTKQTFEYMTYTGGRSTHMTEWMRGESTWEEYKLILVDMVLGGEEPGVGEQDQRGWYVLNEALSDPNAATAQYWVTRYQRAETQFASLERIYTPSAITAYTPASSGTAPIVTIASDKGLVYAYGFNAEGRQIESRISKGEPSGNDIGDYWLLSETTYSSAAGKKHLPVTVKKVRTEGETDISFVAADDLEVTNFEYAFHSGDHAPIAWIRTEVEAENTTENGPGGTYSSWEIYDARGLNTWSIAADGASTKRIYDIDADGTAGASVSRTGSVVAVISNASRSGDGFPSTNVPTTGVPSDRNGSGGSLTSIMRRDVLGRVQEMVSPGGVSHITTRELRENPSRPMFFYYSVVSLPFAFGSGQHDGPATVSWFSAGGQVLGARGSAPSAEYSESSGSTAYRQVIDDYSLSSTLLTRSEVQHTVSGLVSQARRWHDPSDSSGYCR